MPSGGTRTRSWPILPETRLRCAQFTLNPIPEIPEMSPRSTSSSLTCRPRVVWGMGSPVTPLYFMQTFPKVSRFDHSSSKNRAYLFHMYQNSPSSPSQAGLVLLGSDDPQRERPPSRSVSALRA